jgi:hypothetical protein
VADEHNASLEIVLNVLVANAFDPLVRTLSAEADGNGSVSFSGTILADGGLELMGFGVKISDTLQFSNPIILQGNLGNSTNKFSVTSRELESGKNYFYRAYANNAEGTTLGAIKRFTMPANEATQTPWWAEAKAEVDGWRSFEWFGRFYKTNTSWIYHEDLGWVYVQSDAFDGLWLWTEDKGWLWTSPPTYPYLFRNEGSQWLYFLKRRDGQARFYNHASGRVE